MAAIAAGQMRNGRRDARFKTFRQVVLHLCARDLSVGSVFAPGAIVDFSSRGVGIVYPKNYVDIPRRFFVKDNLLGCRRLVYLKWGDVVGEHWTAGCEFDGVLPDDDPLMVAMMANIR